jgi:hypothetical protein
LFTQVIVSPTWTVIVGGTKAKSTMLTRWFAAAAPPGATVGSTTAAAKRNGRLKKTTRAGLRTMEHLQNVGSLGAP